MWYRRKFGVYSSKIVLVGSAGLAEQICANQQLPPKRQDTGSYWTEHPGG